MLHDVDDAHRAPAPGLCVRWLGRVEYLPTEAAMKDFTATREPDTPDEIWICEHPPVYTQGVAGRPEHLLHPGVIPVVQTARGGQVTYHGPGQVVAYPLIDLQRLSIYVREYVYRLEAAVLQVLDSYGIAGHRVPGAPGIYVHPADPGGPARPMGPAQAGDPFRGLAKVAALGIKVSRHCTYHGLAFNVAMDLTPFRGIHPCGYAGLETTDLARLGISTSWDDAAGRLAQRLATLLSR